MKSVKDIEVRYAETDQMGVVYHANYLVWMEVGRTNSFLDMGFNMMDFEEKGYIFPVYSMDIKFLNAARYNEKVRVETEIHEISKLKIVYKQTILNDKDEKKVVAYVTIVCVHKDTFKVVRYDKELPELYKVYCSLCQEK